MPGSLATQYSSQVKRKLFAGCILAILIVTTVTISLQTGAYPLGLGDIVAALFARSDAPTAHVFWNIRLPQVLAAILAGACLGLAGAAMQNVLRNPLASPFTLGISQGAVFGAVFAITVVGVGSVAAQPSVWSQYAIVGCALAGSLLTVTALLVLSSLRDLSPAALILAGVAISAFFGSATMLLQYFASDLEIASAVFWTFGDLKKAQWPQLGIIATTLLPAAFYFLHKGWSFNAMAWGDDTAKSLGISVSSLRLAALTLAALIASVTTAFMGVIGFVGLIAPHLVRMIVGQDHRFLFPYSALAAALVLLVADLFARTVMAPVVLPVGIVTSFTGAPLFLYLLMKHRDIRA